MPILKPIKALIVIYMIEFASADEDFFEFNCKIIEDDTPMYKLKRHLFCDYDPSIRPGCDAKNTTVINAIVIPRKVTFDEYSATLEMNTWFYIEWKDPFLNWDAEEHDDIDALIVRTSEVWIPEVYSLNPINGDMSVPSETTCRLSFRGKLICVYGNKYSLGCISDYTHWPWDVHNCTLQLGAWGYIDEEISFRNHSAMDIDFYRDTDEWKISHPTMTMERGKSKLSSNATFPTVTWTVLLSRTQTMLKAVFVSPIIILTVVTLTILWLKPGSTERLVLSCFNLLGHLLAIRHLHYRIPFNGNVPNISKFAQANVRVIFYHNSLILSSLVLILSFWLQKLLELKRQVPPWLASQVSTILTSKIGQTLSINIMDPQGSALLQDNSDDNTDLVDYQPNTAKWENVVTIIGWLLLFTFTFIYFIMCLVLLC